MSSDKHTPGPWKVGKNFGADYEVRITTVEDEKLIFIGSSRTSGSWEEIGANARLMAAAPDLLGALKDLINFDVKGHALIDRLQFSNGGRDLSAKILGAIAKAEGD